MPRLTIDGIALDIHEGATLMETAARIGVEIPALCHVKGVRPLTSCMLCVVEETTTGQTFPACSKLAGDGMVIETNNPAIRAARKEVLQLLLSEHAGDCEAPCHRICPASLDVPGMMHRVASGDINGATRLVKEELILPATLGYVCEAPCERGCRRAIYDEPLLIRDTHRRLAEESLRKGASGKTDPAASTGKRVAIVGAGAAGLAAAWSLRHCGHACVVFEKASRPGGALRALDEDVLPSALFDAEVATILQLGVELETSCEIGGKIPLADLVGQYDAVILACDGLEDGERSVFQAMESHSTVRSIANGKQAAMKVDDFLQGLPEKKSPKLFDSRLGRFHDDEKALFAVHRMCSENVGQGRFLEDMTQEARRCLHCECLSGLSCLLRKYATEYDAKQFVYRKAVRPRLDALQQAGKIIYEPGKCIRCGLCVEISGQVGESYGLGFVERGYDARVKVPFGRSLAEGLTISAQACIEACPTGALFFASEKEDDS